MQTNNDKETDSRPQDELEDTDEDLKIEPFDDEIVRSDLKMHLCHTVVV